MARFTEDVAIRQSNLGTGGGQAVQSLANRLDQFSSQQAQIASQRLAQDAQTAGIEGQEGFDPSKGLAEQQREVPVLFGQEAQAFNKGLRAAYLAGVARDTRLDLGKSAAKNPENLAMYNDSAAAKRKALADNVDPSARALALSQFDELNNSYQVKIQTNNINKDKELILEEQQTASEVASRDAAKFARDGDLKSSALALEENNAIVDSMDVDPQVKVQLKRANELEVMEQKHKGDADTLYEQGGIKAVNDWLNENETKAPRGFEPDEWNKITNEIQVDANRKEARRRAKKSGSIADLKKQLNDFKTAKSLGFEVSAKSEAHLNKMIAGTELVKDKRIIDETAKFSVMSRDDRASIIDQAQTGDLRDVDMFASIVTADKQITDQAAKDGYALGVKQGLIDEIPMAIGDGEAFSARAEQSELLSTHYGVDVSPLTDTEAQGLADSIPNMTAQEKIQLATMFQSAPAIWGQLDNKNAGQFAMAGATGDMTVMSAIFNGQELLRAKLVTPLTQTDYIAAYDDAVEGVYGVRDKRAVLDAALSYYAATSTSAIDGSYEESDFKDAIEAVTGGIGDINGVKVELPRGVDEGDFEDFIDDMQPETIASLGGVANFTDEQAAIAIQEGMPRSIGAGQYIIQTNGGALFNKNGEPFVITYTQEAAAANSGLFTARETEQLLTRGPF